MTNCEVHIFYSDRHTAKISPINRLTVKKCLIYLTATLILIQVLNAEKIYHIFHSYIHSYSLEKYFTAALILTQVLPWVNSEQKLICNPECDIMNKNIMKKTNTSIIQNLRWKETSVMSNTTPLSHQIIFQEHWI